MTLQDEINARTLQTAKQAQDFAIETIHSVAERVQPWLAQLESLPMIENLPKPSEVVEKAFDLSSVLLAGAKNVAVEAARAFYPGEAPAPPTKPVAVVKKTTAAAPPTRVADAAP